MTKPSTKPKTGLLSIDLGRKDETRDAFFSMGMVGGFTRILSFSTAILISISASAETKEVTPSKNPLPSASPQAPNSTAEEKAMKEQFSQYGFSPRTSKRQTDPSTEPRPLDADAAEEREVERQIDNNRAEAQREYRIERRSSRRGRVARGKRMKKPKSPLPDRATTELMIRPEDRSQEVLATAATVTLKVDQVRSPIKHPSFLVGASVEAYEPRGRAQLQGAASTDFGQPGSKPMVNLDIRWTPLKFAQVPRTQFGFFGSGGYVAHPINIVAPTGAEIENATLSTFKAQVGGVVEWHDTETSNWGLRGQLSLGQLTASQSSSTSFAAGTVSQRFLGAGAYYEYLIFDSVELSIGYERRASVGPESPDFILQKDNLILGLAGGFQ